jgi:hypothetical protein
MIEGLFYWAAQYAAKGWYVVICHGAEGDKCTCKSANCATPGKHPVLNAWQNKSTIDEDELAQWLDGSKNYNIGVQLGEKSGIIDIEFDSDQGRKTAERFGLDKAYTPTFTSKRSTHRLFKWDRRLPQQAVYKLAGLEIRIGGGKKGAQSIMPPSSHASGASYSWVEGMSPDDCEVAEIPRELLVAIVNDVGDGGEKKDRANKILHTPMGEGDRHDSLVRFAARQCIQMLNCHDAVEQQDVLAMIRAMNMQRCNPPKGDDEIENIFRHELAWAQRVRAKGVTEDDQKARAVNDRMENGPEKAAEEDKSLPFTLLGLRYDGTEWWPGQWKLKVIHSDPVSYTLTVPVFREVAGEQKTVRVAVPMDAETFRSAAKVAKAILEATHTVIVDAVPEEWFGIWNGEGAKKGKSAIRAMKAKLMDEATQEAATAENCRFATVAGWLLEVLSMTPKPDDDEEEDGQPDVTGMPAWVRGRDGVWELWFGWQKAWEIVDRGRRKLEEGDKAKIKKMILAGVNQTALPASRGAGEGGRSRRFVRFTDAHMGVLERLAAGDFGAEDETAFSIHEEVSFEIEKI